MVRVICGLMFDPYAAKQHTRTDPFMGIALGAVVTLGAAVVARSAGLSWKGLGHWTGELLLIIGIALAAQGISDVRREWTSRPGIIGHGKQIAQAWRAHVASFLWARWNRIVSWGWLAERLHLRTHLTHVRSGDVVISAEAATATAGALPSQVAMSGNPTIDERLDQLEGLMREADLQISMLRADHGQEVRARQAAAGEEEAARMVEDQRIRDDIADLAGGGLKLQAWGVVCLLAGTLMTAIW